MLPRNWFSSARIVRTTFALGVGVTVQVLAENPDRVYALIGSQSGMDVRLDTVSPIGATEGFVLHAGVTPPFELLFERCGPLVGQAWFGSSAGGVQLTIWEVLVERDTRDTVPPGG